MNGMRCPRCGQTVNAAAAQCPHCGQPLRAAAPATTTAANAMLATSALQQAYDQQKRRNLVIGITSAVIALLLVIFLGARASGGLEAGAIGPDGKPLVAKGTLPGQGLAVKGNTGATPLKQLADIPKPLTMPEDVFNWLRHLEKCENMKVQIAGDQAAEVSVLMTKMSVLGAGIGLMDPYDQSNETEKDQDPGTYTKGKIEDLRPRWQELQVFFRSVPPPAECQPIADDFDRSLSEIPGMMGDIGTILTGAMTDPQAALAGAKKLQNSSYGDIDRYFARCDQKVSAICQKYTVVKWFSIKGDVLSGGMMGSFGSMLPSGGVSGGTLPSPNIPNGGG